jgi:hypothetical protein
MGSNIILWMEAYLHESNSVPGIDRGTGWSLPARLVIENGTLDCPFLPTSLWITDGQVTIGDRLFDNVLPLPFDERGDIHVQFTGPEGQLSISGNRACVEDTGPAVYVEEFPGMGTT